ncbi:MAG: FHA domain-containing protein [Lentisphaeria bacterium]|nr:FHA domain-containing protein [Lentisphaeria bacterium]
MSFGKILTWARAQISRPDPRKAGGGVLLELRCRDQLILSASTLTLSDVVTIGKAPDNDWRIPEIDGTCGAHHAKLILSPRGAKLVACEGYSLYCRGERITCRVLRKNDRVAFGDSELFVKPLPAVQNTCDVHRLEVLGGERDGTMIRLEKSPFRIGSAPDNDLVLDSDTVSLHHAEIRITETGETWLKDLRSSNGTTVNGERLGKQERMLMDSDELSLAQFDFRFLDRNVVHTRTHFGKKLLVMGATVLLALFGFGWFYLLSPSTETVIGAVDFYLFRDQFDAAERMLAQMPESRGFQRYEKQYREYLTRIPDCRRAYQSMLEFQDRLRTSQWDYAAECFGRLDLNNSLVWNPAAPRTAGRIREIAEARKMLGVVLTLREFNSSPYNSKAELQNLAGKFLPHRVDFRKSAAHAPEYLRPLHQELERLLEALDYNIATLRRIEQQAESLAAAPDLETLDAFIAFLRQRQGKVTGVMRVHINDLIFILSEFRINMEALRRNDLALFDLRMNDIKPVSLVPTDECIRFPILYGTRQRMAQHHHDQLLVRDNWLGLQRLLGSYRLIPGTIPEEIRFFSDEKRIERILDLPEIAPGAARRTVGDYDRVFGERYFYEVIQQTVHSTSNIYASDLVPDMKAAPKCVLLKNLYRGMNEALLWMDLPRNRWMLQGRMKETRDYYAQLMTTRPPILRMFENIAARNRGNRKYYIAMSAYFFFAPATPEMPAKMRAFAAEWRKFRLAQQDLLNRYDPMDPAASRQVRDTVVARGIPGDPVFNWMRTMK